MAEYPADMLNLCFTDFCTSVSAACSEEHKELNVSECNGGRWRFLSASSSCEMGSKTRALLETTACNKKLKEWAVKKCFLRCCHVQVSSHLILCGPTVQMIWAVTSGLLAGQVVSGVAPVGNHGVWSCCCCRAVLQCPQWSSNIQQIFQQRESYFAKMTLELWCSWFQAKLSFTAVD